MFLLASVLGTAVYPGRIGRWFHVLVLYPPCTSVFVAGCTRAMFFPCAKTLYLRAFSKNVCLQHAFGYKEMGERVTTSPT